MKPSPEKKRRNETNLEWYEWDCRKDNGAESRKKNFDNVNHNVPNHNDIRIPTFIFKNKIIMTTM